VVLFLRESQKTAAKAKREKKKGRRRFLFFASIRSRTERTELCRTRPQVSSIACIGSVLAKLFSLNYEA
jgi:hypothetical protein